MWIASRRHPARAPLPACVSVWLASRGWRKRPANRRSRSRISPPSLPSAQRLCARPCSMHAAAKSTRRSTMPTAAWSSRKPSPRRRSGWRRCRKASNWSRRISAPSPMRSPRRTFTMPAAPSLHAPWPPPSPASPGSVGKLAKPRTPPPWTPTTSAARMPNCCGRAEQVGRAPSPPSDPLVRHPSQWARRASASAEPLAGRGPAPLSLALLRVAFRQEFQVVDVHIPFLHELQRQDVEAFAELDLGEVVADSPLVPVASGRNDDRPGDIDAVEFQADLGVLVVGGQVSADRVDARLLNVHGVLDPFARRRPTNVEFTVSLVLPVDRLVKLFLCVRDVYALIFAELIQLTGALVQRSATVVAWI